MADQNGSGPVLIAALVGAIAGVAIGMALAPKPGSETRHMIQERVAQGMERIRRRREHQDEDED